MDKLCGSRLFPLPCSIIFPELRGPNLQEDDAKFREFSKRAEDGPSRAGRLSTTFPGVYSRVGWERGILQSCSLFPDRKMLSPRSKHSPHLASLESEPKADSL